MPTVAVTRPALTTDARHARNLARLAGVVAALTALMFAAGYHGINLAAGAAHTIVTTWHITTSPWTYLLAAFAYGATRILRHAND